MVTVSPEEPEEWDVTPDSPEQQQDGVDKQIEQDAMVPSPEISTGPEDLETYMQGRRSELKVEGAERVNITESRNSTA